MAFFNSDIDEIIINFVRDNHCLYDKCDKNFKNVSMKKDVWKKISEILINSYEVNISAEAIEKRWSTLRDMFTRENRRQKLPPSGSGYEPTKEWELYRHMLFLAPHVTHRRTKTSFIPQSQSQSLLLEISNTTNTSSLFKKLKQSSDLTPSLPSHDHNYDKELFQLIEEGEPPINIETEETIESDILNRPASIPSRSNSIISNTNSSILSSEPSTISNQNVKKSLTLKSLNKITPEIYEFAKRRKNKDDQIERELTEVSKEISETMKAVSCQLNNKKQKDDYIFAIEDGFKYIPPRNKTQCLIEVLQIIQKYEERQ